MEHRGYFVLVLLGVLFIGGTAMYSENNIFGALGWQEEDEDLPTIEESIEQLEKIYHADIEIKDTIWSITDQQVTVIAEIVDVEEGFEFGADFIGASCFPPACTGTNTELCNYALGDCTADPCCRIVLGTCATKLCSTVAQPCTQCTGCLATACWTITDACELGYNVDVGGTFINTGGSLDHNAGSLTMECFKKVAVDASYYKKNITAIFRVNGGVCPC